MPPHYQSPGFICDITLVQSLVCTYVCTCTIYMCSIWWFIVSLCGKYVIIIMELDFAVLNSSNGHLNVVRCLVNETRCHPDVKNNSGLTPLHSACR